MPTASQIKIGIDTAVANYVASGEISEADADEVRARAYSLADIESSWGRNNVGQAIGTEISGDMAHAGERAMGPFQFMPSTARDYGLDNPMDPMASADATIRHMIDAYKIQGNWRDAAVGHHSGPSWKQGDLRQHGKDFAKQIDAKYSKYAAQGHNVPMSAIEPGPAYQGGGRLPVSAQQSMQQPGMPPMSIDAAIAPRLAELEQGGRMSKGLALERSFTRMANLFRRPHEGQLPLPAGPEQMTAQQMLQAESQLYRLEESRRENKAKRAQTMQTNQAREAAAKMLESQGRGAEAQMARAGMLDGPDLAEQLEDVRRQQSPAAKYPLGEDLRAQVDAGNMTLKEAIGIEAQQTKVVEDREERFAEKLYKQTEGPRKALSHWDKIKGATPEFIDKPTKGFDGELVKHYNKMVLASEAVMSDDMKIVVHDQSSPLNRLVKDFQGKTLSADDRRELIARMEQLAEIASDAYERTAGQYAERLKLYPNMNPERVFGQEPNLYVPRAEPGTTPTATGAPSSVTPTHGFGTATFR